MTRVCVVGSGGREHALVDALSRTADVVCSPGNPGMPSVAELPSDADLYVIGPEVPLVEGLADRLRADGKLVLGPGADGARLEGSKAWMKEVLAGAGVPTARYRAFSTLEPAIDFLKELPGPWVVKTDGLAAGKGVLVALSIDEAIADVTVKLTKGGVVIEEGLTGPELSVLALCDGTRAVPLPPAQDFKRVGTGDQGPNTGGMGAYSPVPVATDDVVAEVMERAVNPTLQALRDRGIDYRGVLYAGLMLTPDGVKVIEYNVRLGDPETQVVLPRVDDDLVAWFRSAAAGELLPGTPQVSSDACVTVVMASAGYPGPVTTGVPITIGPLPERAFVYHAGTSTKDRQLVTSGGRVLAVTARGITISAARATAYEAVQSIHFDGAHWRTDIAEEASL